MLSVWNKSEVSILQATYREPVRAGVVVHEGTSATEGQGPRVGANHGTGWFHLILSFDTIKVSLFF